MKGAVIIAEQSHSVQVKARQPASALLVLQRKSASSAFAAVALAAR